MGTPCLTSAIHSHKNTFTKENKYTILVHLTVFDHLCPVGAHFDLSGLFQTKVDLWLGSCRQKSMVWTEKNDFVKEVHLKTAFSRRQKTASSHSGRTNYWHQFNSWGITVQTSYWEDRWHQNWVSSRPKQNFTNATCKSVKNGIFLLFGLKLKKEVMDHKR